MKRDMDLIRLILLDVEGEEKPDFFDYTDEQLAYHTRLLRKAGLVERLTARKDGGRPRMTASGLTWAGHEFLDKARSGAVWAKVKALAKEKGAGIALDVLGALVKQATLSQIGS